MLFFGTVSCTAYAIYRLILYPRYFSPLRIVPGPPLAGYLFGHFPKIIRSQAGAIQKEWVDKYGPTVRAVGPLGQDRLILLRPQALHKILVSDWMDYPRSKVMTDILGLAAGHGLFTVTGTPHKQMRKAMNPAFSIANLMNQTDMYYDSIEILVQSLNSELRKQSDPCKGAVMHIFEWMSKVTLDIICDTAFGYKSNSLLNPHNELTEAYAELGVRYETNMGKLAELVRIPGMARLLGSELCYRLRRLFRLFPPLASVESFVDSIHRIRRIAKQLLAEKLADATLDAEDTGPKKKDIMSLLVRAARQEHAEDAYRLSDDALVDQVLTFLGAGHETIASGLSWTLWLLANDAPAQHKLRDEVSPVFADTERPDYRVLKDLKFLDCVIMESLRLFPPAPTTQREAGKSDWIDGVYVPKGTHLSIPIRAINMNRDIWGPDAEEFRPERWLALPKAYDPNFSMMAFIAGPHACIGKTMSISEMKAVLATMLVNFEFAPAYAGQVAVPKSAITMKPADNLPLLVTPIRM
ncbi:cytochrome P450 [Artomyces pyxidatus]|uniref:Cytochrome P450 n=1 Tax=Artomyces pyxidatus TaxID=48021 RepID=A0ACB8ST87_9AGAM|nr:cytochrome P450 [Artomyces pyxidatus]